MYHLITHLLFNKAQAGIVMIVFVFAAMFGAVYISEFISNINLEVSGTGLGYDLIP